MNKKSIAILGLSLLCAGSVFGQTSFSSSSNGQDGILNKTGDVCTGRPIEIDAGSSGVLQYESVTIGEGCLVVFTPAGNGWNSNTGSFDHSNPIQILVQQDVTIAGTIRLNGSDGSSLINGIALAGRGGPGGFNGGDGITGINNRVAGKNGFGPGAGAGGIAPVSQGDGDMGKEGKLSPLFTAPNHQPLTGGSGGGGATYAANQEAGGGGGGGGALLIAASGSITLTDTGLITAKGGTGGNGMKKGGNGSNGMVRLVANTISGNGKIDDAYVILETVNYTGNITSKVNYSNNPNLYKTSFRELTYNVVSTPTVQIVSVGAVSVNSNAATLNVSGDYTVSVATTGLKTGDIVNVCLGGESLATCSGVTIDENGAGSVILPFKMGKSTLTAYIGTYQLNTP
ncbi:MAG: hypothetical protein HQM11_05770 [SAR324 cluster bacterium]|nr:hypothetical protein [SAR324 cluster bacterium]